MQIMEKENKQEITAIQSIYKLLSAVAGDYNNKEILKNELREQKDE